ncbi:MAG: hypothetical protein Q9167_006762 [Letrouitia subvulpina]
MSAEALGAQLLREVEVERLDDLLRSLQANESSLEQSDTNIEALDLLLNAFKPSPSTSLQQWEAQPTGPPQRTLPGRIPLKDKGASVLEICGAEPCSGKTQLLYHIISLQLLPPEHDGIQLHGRGSAVVLLDLDSRFSILRLRDIMKGYISSCPLSPNQVPDADPSDLIHESLQHLHVFRPQSSVSLFATLSTIEGYLFNTASHLSANRCLGAIVLNNLNAFLWQDRLDEAEDPNHDPTVPYPQSSGLLSHRWRQIVVSLRRLRATFSCNVFATSSALSSLVRASRSTGYPNSSLRPHLPGSWTSFVTVKLIVKRNSVRKFASGMSIEEMTREAGMRREAVEKSGFTAWVDWEGSENWREDVRRAMKRMPGNGRFGFKVTANRVLVGEEAEAAEEEGEI